jgi:hypothetical protein
LQQLLGLIATTLTCIFGVGVVEELDLREESREHADQQVSASEQLTDPKRLGPTSLGANPSTDQIDARILAAVSWTTELDQLAEPRPHASRRITALPIQVGSLHGTPVYRVAPSHSPPIV